MPEWRLFGVRLRTHPWDRGVNIQRIPLSHRTARREELLRIADTGGFERIVVWNGAIGFFAGAYQLFAATLTFPLIKLVYYYPGRISTREETLLRTATLIGTIVGMLVFGFLADIYGRRRLYGYELYIMVIAVCGIAMSSRGEGFSMGIFGWLFAWRFVLGVGVGADYPLSATLTAEFAATRHRARMLACVFYAQPLGYLAASVMTVIVVSAYRQHIPMDITNRTCNQDCRVALDKSWRIITGVGVIPIFIAIYFRRTIPESTWYTADVLNRPDDAVHDIVALVGHDNIPADIRSPPAPALRAEPQTDITEPNGIFGRNPPSFQTPNLASPTIPMPPHDQGTPYPGAPTPLVAPTRGSAIATQPLSPAHNRSPLSIASSDDEESAQSFKRRWIDYWESFHEHFISSGHWPKLMAVSVAWFCFDCAYYALLGSSETTISTKIFNRLPLETNCTFADSATLSTWPPPFNTAPDCSSLNLNAKDPDVQSFYEAITGTPWRILVTVCTGAILGGAIMIYRTPNHSPRRVQLFGFLILTAIFLIIGLVLLTVSGSVITGPTVMLYILAHVFFEVGPNFTTFSLPVELFPTRHRAFAHGIAAASGKAGACLFQVFVQYGTFHDRNGSHDINKPSTIWLGYTIICFMPFMLLGAFVTYMWIPETRRATETSRRADRPLEELELLPLPESNSRLSRRVRSSAISFLDVVQRRQTSSSEGSDDAQGANRGGLEMGSVRNLRQQS